MGFIKVVCLYNNDGVTRKRTLESILYTQFNNTSKYGGRIVQTTIFLFNYFSEKNLIVIKTTKLLIN